MKCQKCGYVSFDYLSECKSCGTNISAAREALGLFGVKPSMPSLLSSLLTKGIPEDSVSTGSRPVLPSEPTSFEGLDFGEELDFSSDAEPHEGLSAPSDASAAPAKGSGDADLEDLDALLESATFELSEEDVTYSPQQREPSRELDLEMDFGEELALELESSQHAPEFAKPERPPASRTPGSQESHRSISPETGGVKLFEPDVDELLQSLQIEEEPKPELASGLKPAAAATGVGARVQSDTFGQEDENIDLELSDDDLENLILELDDLGADQIPGVSTSAAEKEKKRIESEKS